MAHSILSNTFTASVGRVVNVLLGVVVTVVVTRSLGHEQFGLYSLLLAWGGLLSILADFGLYLTLTREISQNPEKEDFYITNITSMRLVLLTGVFSVGIVISFFVPVMSDLSLLLIIASVGYVAHSMSQLLMGIYQKYGLMWRVAVGDLLGRIVQLTGILIFLGWYLKGEQDSPYSALLSVVGSFSLGAVIAYFLHRFLLPIRNKFIFSFNWTVWKNIMRQTWPIGAMLLVNAIYFRIDVVVLSFFREPGEVGWYGLAYRVIESSLFFPAMFGGLILPKLSILLADKNLSRAGKLLKESTHFLFGAGALVFVLIVFLATPLLVWLSGEVFAPAGPLLQILSGALFIMFLGNLFGFALVALEKQKILLVLYVFLALFNLGTNLIFIPLYGAVGAAWTTVATEAISASVATYMVRKAIGFKVDFMYVGKIILIAVCTGFFIVVLPDIWHVTVRAGLAIGLYMLLALVLGLIGKERLKLLSNK